MRIGSLLPGSSTPLRNKNVDLNNVAQFQRSFESCLAQVDSFDSLKEAQDLSRRVANAVPELGHESDIDGSYNYSLCLKATKEAFLMLGTIQSASVIVPSDTPMMRLAKLQIIADNVDYSGMDYEEIHSTIWNRYNDTFGGNLMAITSRGCFSGTCEWAAINNQVNDELTQAVWLPIEREIYRATGLHEGDEGYGDYYLEHYGRISDTTFGYAGMSYDEKEAAIYEKYAGKNTLIDFMNMQGELWRTGVLSNKMGDATTSYLDIVDMQLTQHFFPEHFLYGDKVTQEQWNSLFDTEFDVRGFYGEVKEAIKHMTFDNWSFDIQGALLDGADHMLAMLDKRDQARAAGK